MASTQAPLAGPQTPLASPQTPLAGSLTPLTGTLLAGPQIPLGVTNTAPVSGLMDGWTEYLPILQYYFPYWGRCTATLCNLTTGK